MLRKLVRRKVRENFAVDTMYNGILLDKAKFDEKRALQEGKILNKYFDDDLLCHMLIQQEKTTRNRYASLKSKRRLPFYPEYIPLIDVNEIVTKDEYYWLSTTIQYPCIRCNKETTSYLGNFHIKNVLCGECVSTHYMDARNNFRVPIDDKENSRTYVNNMQEFFEINKEVERAKFAKIMKRQRSFYGSKSNDDKQALSKLTRITTLYNSLLD